MRERLSSIEVQLGGCSRAVSLTLHPNTHRRTEMTAASGTATAASAAAAVGPFYSALASPSPSPAAAAAAPFFQES